MFEVIIFNGQKYIVERIGVREGNFYFRLYDMRQEFTTGHISHCENYTLNWHSPEAVEALEKAANALKQKSRSTEPGVVWVDEGA